MFFSDFSEVIIEGVRKRPGPWDKRSKDYAKKKYAKEYDWQKVAEERHSKGEAP